MKSQHWAYAHLPAHLQQYSRPICELALWVSDNLPQSVELNAGLRKLMEAKDCFVRAAIELHGTGSGDRMLPAASGGTHARGLSKEVDPVSGRQLPYRSPYSMAHVPVTPGTEVVKRTFAYDLTTNGVNEYRDGVRYCQHTPQCDIRGDQFGANITRHADCTCGAKPE